jgi:hypothetical protein
MFLRNVGTYLQYNIEDRRLNQSINQSLGHSVVLIVGQLFAQSSNTYVSSSRIQSVSSKCT